MDKYAKDLIEALKEVKFDDKLIAKDFEKKDFLKEYCDFMNYDYDDFKAFMSGEDLQGLLKNEVFKDYQNDFNSNKPKVFKKQSLKENDKKDLFYKSNFFTPNLTPKQQKEAFNSFEKNKEFKELEKAFYYEKFLE